MQFKYKQPLLRRRWQQLRQLRFLQDKLNNLRLSQKLTLGFGLLVGLTFLVVGRNFVSSVRATYITRQTQEVRVPTALASAEAEANLLRMLADVRGYLATGESEFRDRYQASRQDFEADIAQMRALLSESGESQAQLDQLQTVYHDWLQLPEELFYLHDKLIENQPALEILTYKGEIPIAVILNETEKILEVQKARSPSATNMRLLSNLASFRSSFALQIAALRSYLTTRDSAFRFEYGAQFQTNQEAWDELQAQQANLTPAQQEQFAEVAQRREEFLALPEQMFDLLESDQYRQDLYLFRTEAEPLAGEMLGLLNEIVETQQTTLATELQKGRSALLATQWQNLLGGGVALGLSVGMIMLLRRQIADPITRLTQASTRIAQGDFEVKAAVETNDEIGTLAQTFNQMTLSLKQSRAELEDYSHTLEERVEQRTQELQEKNEQIAQTLAELQQTQTQLIQTEKMSALGQMVAGVAHEINNPVNFVHGNVNHAREYLNDILGLLELYQEYYPEPDLAIADEIEAIELDYISEDFPKLLNSMRVGTERIRAIVLSLRNFSRLDEAEMKQANLHEGIENTLMLLQHRLSGKKQDVPITVETHYGELPLIDCYPGQLNQVFMNIIVNAIDALNERASQQPEPPCAITITTEHLASDQYIQVRIKDNAGGMPPEVQQRLFDPFFTTKPVGKGTGLGLAITYQIVVERHKGKLLFSSEVGAGTEFCIEIPTRLKQDHW